MDRRLIPDFITDNFSKNNLSGSFKGYILFIDMVGFTSITESLFKEGKAGAEILSKLIDRVFSELINEIHLRNGFISSFAGDAFTAVFQTEDYLQVISACISLKEKMTRLDLTDLKIKRRVSVRISASYGKINWEIAGGESRKTYYFSGYPIKRSPKLQEENPGKGVILDHSIIKQITNPCIKYRRIGEREYILTRFDRDQIKNIRQSLKFSRKRTNLITPEFIDSKIIDLNVKGEFREVVSLFVKFPFKTVNNDFLEFINKVLVYSEEFGGYFNGLEFGEKTPHFSVIFGAPLSFENNIERALKFFFKIKEENINISAGITSGRAYAGYIGSKQRETYTVLGNAVNLAARLMSKSKPGEILCSEALLKKLPSSFRNIKTTTEKLKGFKSNVQLFSLTKEIRLNIPSDDSQIKFIGRTEEKRKLNDRINKIESGRFGGVVTVYGEPGIGKTRLINEVLQNKSKELNIVYLKSDQLLKKGLNPFINYFSQNFFSDQTESIIEKENEFILRINKLTEFSKEIDEVTAALIEDLKVRQKYLGFLLDLFTNDPLLKSSDPKAIYQQSLIVIKDYFKILSLNRPLIIFFDDLQWIDDESIEVFRNLVRNIEDYPILIIFTSRYKDDGTKPGIDFSDEVSSYEIELLDLAENESEEFIFEYLPRDTEKKLITSIIKKGESNPFFLEQICLYIIENKIISKSNKTLHSTELEIPSEINQILISRIDRLSSKMNEIVKTASVLGLEFDIEILSRILKGIDLNRYLEMGKDARIWNELSQIQYIFRHSIMRDAVYQMQLNSHLKELHRLTGEAFEKHYSKRKDKHADKAYHFEKAEMISKAVRYYQLAGEYCSSYYRNQEAVKCYEKVLHYSTETQKKLEINLKIARIQSLTGDWQSAEKRFRNILQSAKEENLKRIYLNCKNAFAHLLVDRGDYTESEKLAKELLNELNRNDENEIKILFSSFGTLALINYHKGNYKISEEYYQKSLKLKSEAKTRDELAKIYSGLGLLYWKTGKYDAAVKYFEKSRSSGRKIQNKRAEMGAIIDLGNIHFNLNQLDKAMSKYKVGLEIANQIGDLSSMALVSGNIGAVYFIKNEIDKALEYSLLNLKIAKELGNKRQIAKMTGNLGSIYASRGNFQKAKEYYFERIRYAKEQEDSEGEGITLGNLAEVFNLEESHELSEKYFMQSIEILRNINSNYHLIMSLFRFGELLFELGRIEEIKKLLSEADAILAVSKTNKDDFTWIVLRLNVKYYDSPEKLESELLKLLNQYNSPVDHFLIYYHIILYANKPGYFSKLKDAYIKIPDKSKSINEIKKLKKVEEYLNPGGEVTHE